MALIDIDIEDYLDEVEDDDLITELERRGYMCVDASASNEDKVESSRCMPEKYVIRRNFDSKELRKHLENLTGLGGFASEEDILNGVKDLLVNS